jgi:DNA-3-methyladenine glycosylase
MSTGSCLTRSFFGRDVLQVARELVGCTLIANGAGGVIVETEAYNSDDPACHAYRGMTDRNRVMFGPPGRAYVYFTYGMHYLFNIVCEQKGDPAGVLIRALEPTIGIEAMRRRRSPVTSMAELTNGPAKITQALAIGPEMYGKPVYRGALKVYPRTTELQRIRIEATPRIGIRVGTRRKWRFCAADSRYLSRKLRAKGAPN